MRYNDMTENELDEVVNKYIEYYNNCEDGCWTYEKAYKRIHQVMTTEDSMCLVQYDDEGSMTGFVMGYFKQYDDILGYFLEEIVVFSGYQGKGYGSLLMTKLEEKVKEMGANHLEFLSVNDEHHSHFYGKFGYYAADNFRIMGKHWEM
ncbi:GNAT family N-acetyltransferase [Butyrivibrio sp. VCD2006]|uniref:GNAT family N-acetyltransferase n=1 Tax=Butyrivibrio sp. VCD2006 TaxID=1280664 RepID=UPI0003FF3BAA|nr:GNAT family N-acetyltransferase [Butyrivibrio sp. VCD2006]